MGPLLGYQIRLGDLLVAFVLAVLAPWLLQKVQKFWLQLSDILLAQFQSARQRRVATLKLKLSEFNLAAHDKEYRSMKLIIGFSMAAKDGFQAILFLVTTSMVVELDVYLHELVHPHVSAPNFVNGILGSPDNIRRFIENYVVRFTLTVTVFLTSYFVLATLFSFGRTTPFLNPDAEISKLQRRVKALTFDGDIGTD
jgi:hypothetical protein